MSKFIKKGKKGNPAISTASLPDIVFMLLFFFMVSTVMREDDPKVKIERPSASEVQKLKKKSLVDYINIGVPYDERYGKEPLMQLDDAFATVDDIADWIDGNRDQRQEGEIPLITTSFKVDIDTKMGLITDIKQALRQKSALKINYSTNAKQRTK